ncbi:Sbe22 protein [Saccharomycopsis crataegensis]|uniref:Sbe22 protein n=1 Tax=Saccharomycopsis crataegensis TaxID=43959 RepID=A0AAV5QMF2_9ASCO|nr:Sbe22 protein [Saccharomycopsis crataegensis]
MSIIEHSLHHISPKPMQYVPKSSKKNKTGNGRSLSKSKSLGSLNSQFPEPTEPQSESEIISSPRTDTKKNSDYAKYEKILSAVQDDDFQDVDLLSFRKLGLSNDDNSNNDYGIKDFKKFHDSLQNQNRTLGHKGSASNLRISLNNTGSTSSLGSPSLNMPKKFHHNGSVPDSPSSSVHNLGGLVSGNSSVHSLKNNASFVRGLGINKSQVRRPSDNLSSLKHSNTSQSFDSKSDSISSGLASVSEDYDSTITHPHKQRIEEQITIPNALSKPYNSQIFTKTCKNGGKEKVNERPFSDDSMLSSTSSNFEFENEFDSRISSLTSMENVSQILSSPENDDTFHEKTPKMTETPQFMNLSTSEDYEFDNNNDASHKRTPSDFTDNTINLGNASQEGIENSTISLNTINSNNTVLELSYSNPDATSTNTPSSPRLESNFDDTTKQNTLYNASSSTIHVPKRRSDGMMRRKSLNRVASMPALNNDRRSHPLSPSLGSSKQNAIGLGLSTVYNGSSLTLDSVVSAHGSPLISSDGTTIVSPSQKFKLRRQLSKKNLSAFREELSNINTEDEVIDLEDSASSSIFFNIPYASGSTATLFSTNPNSKQSRQKIINASQTSIPISPLVNNVHNNTMNDQTFANDLSRFYTDVSDNYIASELAKREENHTKLPSYIMSQIESQSSIHSLSPRSSVSLDSSQNSSQSHADVASSASQAPALSHTIDELRLMSPEKIDILSSTRPMWLPPKSAHEDSKHQQQISEAFESYSKKEIDKKERNFQRLKNSLINNQKWFELTVKHKEIHKPVIYSMRHLCWKTNIPNDLRYKVWNDVLSYYDSKHNDTNDNTDDGGDGSLVTTETYDDLSEKLSTINTDYLEPEIDLIIESLFPRLELFQTGQKLNSILKKMLLIQKISKNGLNYGDEVLIALFLLYFTPAEVFRILSLVNVNVMNDVFKTKFNSNLESNYTMKKYLGKHFKDEMPLINTRNLYKIFMKIDPELMINVFDFLVLNNSYKVCYCFMLLVLKFYHFGFADLRALTVGDSMFIEVDDADEFLARFQHYYNKF